MAPTRARKARCRLRCSLPEHAHKVGTQESLQMNFIGVQGATAGTKPHTNHSESYTFISKTRGSAIHKQSPAERLHVGI